MSHDLCDSTTHTLSKFSILLFMLISVMPFPVLTNVGSSNVVKRKDTVDGRVGEGSLTAANLVVQPENGRRFIGHTVRDQESGRNSRWVCGQGHRSILLEQSSFPLKARCGCEKDEKSQG